MSKIRNRCAYFKQKAKNIREANLKKLENAHKQMIESSKQKKNMKPVSTPKPKTKNKKDKKTHKTVKDEKSLNKFLARMERRETKINRMLKKHLHKEIARLEKKLKKNLEKKIRKNTSITTTE